MVRNCLCLGHRLIVAWLLLCALTTSSVRAQQAGVLLGYFGRDAATPYETMWVVFSANEARAIATVPESVATGIS